MASSGNKLNKLINSEKAFFSKINPSLRQISKTDLMQWRNETVEERRKRISLDLYGRVNGVVKYGPFKGMKLVEENWWGKADLGSQCLGLYEKEILNIINKVKRDEYNTFIDIGAADGYYAVGMLVSGKVSDCICFEKSDYGRKVIVKNWENNGSIGHLKVFEEANLETIASLDPNLINKALILIDIEGAEFDLLDSNFLNICANSTLIMEIHNWVENFEELYIQLLTKADKFFDIEIIDHSDRPINHILEIQDFSDDNRNLLVSEGRPSLMRYLKLNPR